MLKDIRSTLHKMYKEAVKPDKKLKSGRKGKQLPYNLNDICLKVKETIARAG